ncbi:hypothetical protein EJD97_003209 [Solanum chilense]|uniref:Uncharacterized protein n=1 Tax=Solanum chilense TaxID=4083 RepID=A0A6N2C1I3_SOLCI|nr:hypothetical protein EJD97_003209 [Solanum chilense]
MTSMKINSQSISSRSTSSKLSTEVEDILGVPFGSFGAVTRRKSPMLGEISVAEIKKTLSLLEQSGSKNSTTRKNYDSTNESSPRASLNVIPLKINLLNNPCYSPTSPMMMQTMVTGASSPEEQLTNLTKLVEGLTNHVQHQESRIDKLMD